MSDPRVVLVTGASAGIGRAVADRLAGDGWTVVGASRRGTGGEGWEGIVLDVDDDEAVGAAVAELTGRHGRLDALVAAAGYGLCGAVEHTTMAEARAQLETNFFGVARCLAACLAPLRDSRGRVVVIGSIGGVIGLPFQAYYSASKFALEGLVEALAHEVRPFGVGVTVVEPGNIRTEFTAARREAAGAAGDPVYGPALAHALEVMARDEQAGPPPSVVAATVARVLAARRPPRRVSAGRAGERVGVVAKRLLPGRLFEAASRGALGV